MSRRTLQSSGNMTTNDLVYVCQGDLGSPFAFPNDVRGYLSLPSGTCTFPNDCYGKSYGTTDNGGCVAADSWFPDGSRAQDAKLGQSLLSLNYATMAGTSLALVQRFNLEPQPCVRITTASGISLVASTSTPVTYRDHSMSPITECLERDLPVKDRAGFRWESIVKIEDAGMRQVAHIYAGHATFAAGERPDAFIFTHNIKQ